MSCSFLRPPVDTDKPKQDLQKDLESIKSYIKEEPKFMLKLKNGEFIDIFDISLHAIQRAMEAEERIAEYEPMTAGETFAFASKKIQKENAELRKQLDETIDDLIITQKNHNSAHDESLRFEQRLIEAEGINEQFEAQCAVMREAINYVISILNRTDEYKESDLLHWVMNDANKFLSQTAGRELLDKVKDLELSRDALCTVHNLECDKVKRYEEALKEIKLRVCGERAPYWKNDFAVTGSRSFIADCADKALEGAK